MAEHIITFVEQYGYAAVALLMLVENVFPPLPSELIMPFAGFAAARGELSVAGVVLAGTAGSLLGTLPWYFAGRWLGDRRLKRWAGRHGRWITMSPGDIDRADRWFDRHGRKAVVFGRLVPALRSVISAPAGITGMALAPFLLWSAIGTAVWTGTLAGIGFALEDRYEEVARWLSPVSIGVLVIGIAIWLWRVARFKPRAAA